MHVIFIWIREKADIATQITEIRSEWTQKISHTWLDQTHASILGLFRSVDLDIYELIHSTILIQ